MIKKENKALKYISFIYGILGLAYMWFYDLYFQPNPLYGDRASTASNVGRDHWPFFILWGIALAGSLVLNIFYALDKFEVKRRLPKVASLLSLVAITGVVLCKNEKLKRLSFTLNFETYTAPTYTSDYSEQTLATQKNLINYFLSMKSLHSAFAVSFGLCIAVAVVTFLFTKSRDNVKFKKLTYGFFIWICACAFYLKLCLGGTAELVVITLTIGAMMVLFHTDLLMDKADKKETKPIKETAVK